ncbi:hypothetical protein C0J52_19763 [Blattella germanica]|nr:hypothetical protein C0J52_19763 [Blattella germanica]
MSMTLLICDAGDTDVDHIQNSFNNINNSIKYTLEKEDNNRKNYLDLTITRSTNSTEFSIYRIPTNSDLCIHNSSRHPIQHKLSTFNSLIHRLINIPMSKENHDNELKDIKCLTTKNGYKDQINIIKKEKQNKMNLNLVTALTPEYDNNRKWITLTYLELLMIMGWSLKSARTI